MRVSRIAQSRPYAAMTTLAWLIALTTASAEEPPKEIVSFFHPPPQFQGDLGSYRSPLTFNDGRPVRTAADWPERRREILRSWEESLGSWPPLIERPKFE